MGAELDLAGKTRLSRIPGEFERSHHPPAPFQILEGGAVFTMEFSAKNGRETPFAGQCQNVVCSKNYDSSSLIEPAGATWVRRHEVLGAAAG